MVPTINLPFVLGFATSLLILNLDRPKSGFTSLTTSIAMFDFLTTTFTMLYDHHDLIMVMVRMIGVEGYVLRRTDIRRRYEA
jgi:ABC-type uncharacterized transport system permease subunit